MILTSAFNEYCRWSRTPDDNYCIPLIFKCNGVQYQRYFKSLDDKISYINRKLVDDEINIVTV